jgi:hypothetical protein
MIDVPQCGKSPAQAMKQATSFKRLALETTTAERAKWASVAK